MLNGLLATELLDYFVLQLLLAICQYQIGYDNSLTLFLQ